MGGWGGENRKQDDKTTFRDGFQGGHIGAEPLPQPEAIPHPNPFLHPTLPLNPTPFLEFFNANYWLRASFKLERYMAEILYHASRASIYITFHNVSLPCHLISVSTNTCFPAIIPACVHSSGCSFPPPPPLHHFLNFLFAYFSRKLEQEKLKCSNCLLGCHSRPKLF